MNAEKREAVKMTETDGEADAMFLVAVQNSLHHLIEDAIANHCAIVPERLSAEFSDWVAEAHLFAWGKKFSGQPGVPDLYGDDKYAEYVAGKLKKRTEP